MPEEDLGDLIFGNKVYFEFRVWVYLCTGVFQLKRARSYAEERCTTIDLTGVVDCTAQLCRSIPNLVRAPTKSTHSNRVILPPYSTIYRSANNRLVVWFLYWCAIYKLLKPYIICHMTFVLQTVADEKASHVIWKLYAAGHRSIMEVSNFYDSSDGDDDDNTRYSLSWIAPND